MTSERITYITDYKPDTNKRVLVEFAQHDDMWMADVYTVTLCGVLIGNGIVSRGKTLEGCKRGFKRASKHYFGSDVNLVRIVHEGEPLVSYSYKRSFYTDPTDPSVHENFKRWVPQLFASELEVSCVWSCEDDALSDNDNCEDAVSQMAYDAFAMLHDGATPNDSEEVEQFYRMMSVAVELVRRDGPDRGVNWIEYRF